MFKVYHDCKLPTQCKQAPLSETHLRGTFLNPFLALALLKSLRRRHPKSQYFLTAFGKRVSL